MMAETNAGLMDYHLHTSVTVDGMMGEAEACEHALARGIREIAFTNHVMLNQPAYLTSPRAYVQHWERIQACQARFPALEIRLGIEMDYYPGREADIAASLRQYETALGRPFDLILGSVHELNGVFFSNRQRAPALYQDRDLAALYVDYFQVATAAVRSRLYDVMAHPDLIKKYAGDLTGTVSFPEYEKVVGPYVDALLETRVGMELNTKGLKLAVAEAYPAKEILALYLLKAKELGEDPILTIGSDAHWADEVGDGLPDGMAILRDLGVKALTRFRGHATTPWQL